jgi:hypothetical protein
MNNVFLLAVAATVWFWGYRIIDELVMLDRHAVYINHQSYWGPERVRAPRWLVHARETLFVVLTFAWSVAAAYLVCQWWE